MPETVLVFHIPETRSERVIWLLEEMGQPYAVQRLSYRAGDTRKADFLALNPFGMVPTIRVADRSIRETGAIFEYLIERSDRKLAVASDDPMYIDYLEWMHSIEATVFQPLVAYIMNTEVLPEPERVSEVARRSATTWSSYVRLVDDALRGRTYLCGERFTAADILMGHALRMADASRVIDAHASNVRRYFETLRVRPAYQRMLRA